MKRIAINVVGLTRSMLLVATALTMGCRFQPLFVTTHERVIEPVDSAQQPFDFATEERRYSPADSDPVMPDPKSLIPDSWPETIEVTKGGEVVRVCDRVELFSEGFQIGWEECIEDRERGLKDYHPRPTVDTAKATNDLDLNLSQECGFSRQAREHGRAACERAYEAMEAKDS